MISLLVSKHPTNKWQSGVYHAAEMDMTYSFKQKCFVRHNKSII